MSKISTVHRCGSCGSTQPRWTGRCPACGQWNSLQEEHAPPLVLHRAHLSRRATADQADLWGTGPQALVEVDVRGHLPVPTGVPELDRVLAGGLLPRSATLLGGEPGTGKSTLLLQALASMALAGRRCLLVAAEEPAQQVRRRATRLGADVPDVFVVEATQLPAIEAAIAQLSPDVVVVDSVQAVSDPELASGAGSVLQVRECASSLAAAARAVGAALVLVGHVTKDGALAGPRALEHLVDTVLSFEGDRYLSLRALRAVKHRFGPTGETGLFEMGESGLSGVDDPSALFLGDRLVGSPGSAVAVPVEGYRAVLVEVQALVGRTSQVPRRLVTGVDAGRVGFLVAVLHERAQVPVSDRDVYVSVTGGARAIEPATDLAICLALTSALGEIPVPPELIAVGEVGLGGELRRAGGMAKRLAEAQRLGFETALLPAERSRVPRARGAGGQTAHPAGAGLRELRAPSLREALVLTFGERALAEALHQHNRRVRSSERT